MTVWAAFGPYDTAESAEQFLRLASRAVFGQEGITDHEKWIDEHVKNFHKWQAESTLEKMLKMMCAGLLLSAKGRAFETACKQFKEEAEAQVKNGIEWLNKDFLEEGGHKLDAVKQQDGTVQFAYKQIWSDEEIKRKKREDGEAILNAVGRNLLEDQSYEAKALLAFLGVVNQENMDKGLETPKDVGAIWFACLEVVDKEPNTPVALTFKVLNDAWAATRSEK